MSENDPTEAIRREQVVEINSQVKSDREAAERKRLEEIYGQVWNTEELSRDFKVIGFMAPYCVVRHLETMKKGTLAFQHHPRFYFNFQED